MCSPCRACAFSKLKMMSCLRERAMFSTPYLAARSTSLLIGIAFSVVRFIDLREAASSSALMISASSPVSMKGAWSIGPSSIIGPPTLPCRPPPLPPRFGSRLPWRGPFCRLRPGLPK